MNLRIDPSRAALLVVDIQERLASAMPADDLATCQKNVLVLVELARRLGMPVVASEQYPRGLGPTIAPLAEAFAQPGLTLRRFEKLDFSCTEASAFEPIHRELERKQWIVTGMETHVCVYQTVRGLCERGYDVQVVGDAVCSRTAANHALGLSLAERAGALVTATEVVVFDALSKAGSDDFKAMSKLIK